jgi:hypothetical protein
VAWSNSIETIVGEPGLAVAGDTPSTRESDAAATTAKAAMMAADHGLRRRPTT